MSIRVLHGDCRDVLKSLPEQSVHCVVTSPPYFGLRDYGTGSWEGGDPECAHLEVQPQAREGRETPGGRGGTLPQSQRAFRDACRKCGARRIDRQIGLEPTPDAYVAEMVAVFRDVKRVLRDDGTCWLNIGDSYNSTAAGNKTPSGISENTAKRQTMDLSAYNTQRAKLVVGCKPKDLLMIPAQVALALRQPYYAGRIKNELDRVWLAAMIDAEGCMFIHKRKVGQSNGQGYVRKSDTFGSGLEVANCSLAVVERCQQITGVGTIFKHDKDRRQSLYRWQLRSNECRSIIREVYPYLVAKQHQARLLCGCPSSGSQAEAAHEGVIALHNGSDVTVDFPAPEPMTEPGWYLRSHIIWAKKNPMPESVTDRPTSAHESIFLLTKRSRYFYDADAVREPQNEGTLARYAYGFNKVGKGIQENGASHSKGNGADAGSIEPNTAGRNLRNVWTVATQPFSGAHFATFPPDLIEPCIKAGTSEKGCCPECGASWVRDVEVLERAGHKPRLDEKNFNSVTRQLGWSPSCSCYPLLENAPPCFVPRVVPCTVLDPFGGAGTTGLVADRLQRNAILIELNPEYAAMARSRLANDAGMFADVEAA